jgi:hypothetical protein
MIEFKPAVLDGATVGVGESSLNVKWLVFCLALLGILIFACNDKRKPMPPKYFKDTRTGLCFADVGHKLAHVPCEAIPLELLEER